MIQLDALHYSFSSCITPPFLQTCISLILPSRIEGDSEDRGLVQLLCRL